MAFEFKMLIVMTFFYMFAWLPSSIAKLKTYGRKWLASNRTPVKDKELPNWGNRVERAHNNLKDNFPAFVVAILLLGVLNKFDSVTHWLSLSYVLARLGHMFFYGIGHVNGRFITYLVGVISNVILLFKAF